MRQLPEVEGSGVAARRVPDSTLHTCTHALPSPTSTYESLVGLQATAVREELFTSLRELTIRCSIFLTISPCSMLRMMIECWSTVARSLLGAGRV